MKKLLTLSVASLIALQIIAQRTDEQAIFDSEETTTASENTSTASEFAPQDNYEEGFLTQQLNRAIAKGMEKAEEKAEQKANNTGYGRKLTDYVSPPTFGGYILAGYYYSGKEGAHDGDGFKQKNARLYVKGSILKDFNYLVQVQFTNDKFHMKDYYLEWAKYKGFQIKAGQFIRAFGYECPYNPFEFYEHSYAQISQKLAAQADRIGIDNGGGRDQGIQIQGDLFPIGKDKHRLFHYQLMLSNGQTINSVDHNYQKDVSGCVAFQPIAGLRLAAWGWLGTATAPAGTTINGIKCDGATVHRNRYMLSAFYDKNDWTFRTEYAHSTGNTIVAEAQGETNDKAQGWYATVGIPCTKWLKTYVKYDAYEDNGKSNSLRSVYSISAHIALHKNLYFLPSVGYVTEKNPSAATSKYCQINAEMGIRF